jgi:hypothetical protein
MAVVSSTSDPQLLVSCDTWLDFVEHYAGDLRKGGLYVATDVVPKLLSAIDVRLSLPEATEIVLRARVVQVLSDEQASAVGKAAGVGLELADMDAERKRQIGQLLEFARWQGEQNDPNASFARMLLEMSPSLAPAEVGYRLSLIPGATPRSSDNPIAIAARKAAESQLKRSNEANVRPEVGSRQRLKAATDVPQSDRVPTGSQSQLEAQDGEMAPAEPTLPPKPSDPIKLKLVLTEFAHKHYEAALRVTREMLDGNPGDPQALRWQHMCNARIALSRNDIPAAVSHYELALPYDEDNREARDFVRNHHRDKKLNAIPFGRYFTKKK